MDGSLSEEDILTLIQRRLAADADVGARDADGRTLLFSAAANGHARVATLLLDEGADVNARDLEGSTPLHFAAAEGQSHLITLLISRGAMVNPEGSMGVSPTFLAAAYGHAEAWGTLRKHGGK